jgi:4-amino-4-deoxy-L-arabinose transferase-like glycosyltransferase
VVAIAFVLAAALTWRKWPDLLVDFGGQLYIPWRIANGAVLYRDLFYFAGGPLSQYFNALLFKIFGVSFSTIIAANITLTAALLLLIYQRFTAAADAWSATMIGIAIVFVFAFGEITPIGNYNYITPYSHEAFHGLVLSIVAIALLADWIKQGKIWMAAAAGFCAGLVFLTKPDIFTALAVTVVAALVLFYRTRKGVVKPLAAFIVTGIVPSLFFLLYFLRVESLGDSARSVVFGWLPLLHGEVTKSPFYLWCTGLDQPLPHLESIFLYFLAAVAGIAVYALALRQLKKIGDVKKQSIVLVLLALPVLYWAYRFPWFQCGWPLPLLCLSSCVLIVLNYRQMQEQAVFPLLWSVFGLLLLAKLGLFPRVWHYGFVLAMPAFVSSVYLLFWLLPQVLEKKKMIVAWQFRAIVGTVLLIGIVNLFSDSEAVYSQKKFPIGGIGDEIVANDLTSDTSKGIYAALLWSQEFMPGNATLAVLPQGVMINYLMRRVDPTPGIDWNPTMFTVFGQDRMTDAFEAHPPDYVFIVEWSAADFGVGYFGSSPEYGQRLIQWIYHNYQPVLLIGHEPLQNGLFGIRIWKRLPLAQAEAKSP